MEPDGESTTGDVIDRLEHVLRDRRAARPEGSYSVRLFDDRELVQRKVMEEAFETCLELGREPVNHERLVEEAADLVYHLLVGLVDAGVSFTDVRAELDRRRS